MREILFRGKRIDDGEWLFGSLLVETIQPDSGAEYKLYEISDITRGVFPNDFMSGYEDPVEPETIGQYTGLTDKAGTKAFEHDCIRELFGDAIGVIRYGEYRNSFNDDKFTCHIGFYVDWVSGRNKEMLRKDLGYWFNLVEIIGNIHDNPELMEEGNA